MKNTILAISTFMLGILSITSLSFIQDGDAMATATAVSSSVLCFYDEDTNEPISGLDDTDYYSAMPIETDIGNDQWRFTSVRDIEDGCYQFGFEGGGSVFISFWNLPDEYKSTMKYNKIYSSASSPYPSAGFKISKADTQTRSGDYSGTFDFDISDYLDANVSTDDYGDDIQEYVELAEAYKEMAQDYSELACDEAEAALAARNEGDYEGFQEHMENSNAAAEAAQDAADAAQEYADTVQDLADTAAGGGSTSDGGLGIDFGWPSESGLGQTYDIDDIPMVWDMTPNWSREDLMGVYTDPTWGMENIPLAWEYDQYIDPEYWIQGSIIQESYYDENPSDEYYQEAVDFYGSILMGDDLERFQEDPGYHDFLVNVYVNTFNETAAYQATVTETYTQGHIGFEAYEANIQGQVSGYEATELDTLSANYWSTDLASSGVEMYFDSGSTDADYLAAVSFYETNLTGSDLSSFQNNESYHNYLVNSYITGVAADASYASSLESDIDAGLASFSNFNTNFSDASMFESSAMTQLQGMQEQSMMQNVFNFTSY